MYCCGNLRNLDGNLVNDKERSVCYRTLIKTNVNAFKLCRVNMHVARKRCAISTHLLNLLQLKM